MKHSMSKYLIGTILAFVLLAHIGVGEARASFEVEEGDIVIDNSESDYVTISPVADWNHITGNHDRAAYVPEGASVRYLQSYLTRDKDAYVEYKPQGEKALEAGYYEVYLSYANLSNLYNNVQVNLYHNNDYSIEFMNMRSTGGSWSLLGTFYFSGDETEYVRIKTAGTPTAGGGYVIADAVRFVKNTELPPEEHKLDANLAELTVDVEELQPKFHPGVTEYEVGVGKTVASIEITATVSESVYTSLTIAGDGAQSGIPFQVNLNPGLNEIPILVTADNDETQTEKTYWVKVMREYDDDATLNDLSVASYTFTPAFDPEVTHYQLDELPISDESVEILATVNSSLHLGMTINEIPVDSGETHTVPLVLGTNLISIQVTAENGETKEYIVRVDRASKQGDVSGPGNQPDGRHSIADLGFVSYHFGANEDNPNWTDIQRADLNGNGVIDEEDVLWIAEMLE